MEIFIVKKIYNGDGFANNYDDIGFTDYNEAVKYADAKNKEMYNIRDKYNECEFAASEIINRMFLLYLKENDKEKYEEFFCNDFTSMNEEFWDNFHKEKDIFMMSPDNLLEKEMIKNKVSDVHKGMVRTYVDYKAYGNDGLPYYSVTISPIKVFETAESVEQ